MFSSMERFRNAEIYRNDDNKEMSLVRYKMRISNRTLLRILNWWTSDFTVTASN